MALSGDGGKGYGRRPQLAPNNQVESNWETIFGSKHPKHNKTDEGPKDHKPVDNTPKE
jgi:hypothetical protein